MRYNRREVHFWNVTSTFTQNHLNLGSDEYLCDILSVGVGSSELVIRYYEMKTGKRVCKFTDDALQLQALSSSSSSSSSSPFYTTVASDNEV